MIPPLKAVHRILWGNIELNGKNIPVVKRTYPYDKIPCVTVDDSGGSAFIDRLITNEKYPVPTTHPQYDKNDPFKKLPQQVLREYWETNLTINVWCNEEDEREEITNIIQKLFKEAQSDHYKFCDNYRDGHCTYLDTPCHAEHFTKLNARIAKNQCPKPLIYNYKNVFTTYNLIRASFYLGQPYSTEDFSKDEVVLRNMMKLHTGYYTDHIIGGIVSTKLEYKEE